MDAFAVTAEETLLVTAEKEWCVVEEVNADWLTVIAELTLREAEDEETSTREDSNVGTLEVMISVDETTAEEVDPGETFEAKEVGYSAEELECSAEKTGAIDEAVVEEVTFSIDEVTDGATEEDSATKAGADDDLETEVVVGTTDSSFEEAEELEDGTGTKTLDFVVTGVSEAIVDSIEVSLEEVVVNVDSIFGATKAEDVDKTFEVLVITTGVVSTVSMEVLLVEAGTVSVGSAVGVAATNRPVPVTRIVVKVPSVVKTYSVTGITSTTLEVMVIVVSSLVAARTLRAARRRSKRETPNLDIMD